MHKNDPLSFQVYRKGMKGCECDWAQKSPGPSGEVSPEKPGRILSQYINPSVLGVRAHLDVMTIVMVLKCISVIGHNRSQLYENISDPLFICQVLFFTNHKKMAISSQFQRWEFVSDYRM
jgi:hypothetical protein